MNKRLCLKGVELLNLNYSLSREGMIMKINSFTIQKKLF